MSRNRLLIVSSFVVGLFFTGVASGQGMPDPERKALDRLVGTWKSEDRVGDTVLKGELVVEWKADGAVLFWCWKGPMLDAPDRSVTSAGMIGWDGREKAVTERSMASTGEGFNAWWKMTATDQWESPCKGSLLIDGEFQLENSVRIIKFKSTSQFEVLTTKRMLDGKEQSDIVSTYTR